MKAKLFLPTGVGFLLIAASFTRQANPEPAITEVKLQQAEKELTVKAKITSKGEYSGDCMNLELTNMKSGARQILIPAGTLFVADDAGEQNILVTHDLTVQLKPHEKKMVDLTGYCCEKSDAAPGEGSTFTTSVHTDEKVLKLLDFLKDKQYGTEATQDAVWCVANGSPVSCIYQSDVNKQNELRKFVCELTGQEDTWYTTRQQRSIGEDRMIQSSPVQVKGMLGFTAEKPMNVVKKIYDSKDSLLYTLGNGMNLPRAGYYEYEFNITVAGWEKGKYYVLVMGGDKQLKRQDFEI